MNQEEYLLELRKIIRLVVKSIDCENLKEHIYVIKCILIFISKIVLIKLEINQDIDTKDIHNILINFEEIEFGEDFLFKDIEDINTEYKYNDVLDHETKKNLIKTINKIGHDELVNFSMGKLYEYFTTSTEKKYLGQVYTPRDIVKFMVDSNLREQDIIDNPYFKVIDPACGGGYFLIEVYEKIKKIIIENYDKIIKYDNKIKAHLEDGVHQFILKNNIWGLDIDDFAVYMTRFSLSIRGKTKYINIFKSDALLGDESYLNNSNYDLVIGNPPYIGHKKIEKEYRSFLSESYSEVYSDKSDISYCFFKKSYDLLSKSGRLSFITSRYFIESPSGKDVRNFIKNRFSIKSIIDFYGENVFKGVGISPLIINCIKEETKLNNIQIYRRKGNKKSNSFNENIANNFVEFTTKQDNLRDSGWILLSYSEKDLFDKINTSGKTNLEELCIFKQGIITGCDKAFIVDDTELAEYQFEKNLIKPWIKNSDIDSFYIKPIKKYIIYTDNIDIEADYTYSIEWIKKYKQKLSNRRECKNGIRKWYELQWGRDEELFKGEKIVFPYKANKNKFAISKNEICSSADVYFIKLKDNFKNQISLEYLLAFLNSKLCEYYFKCIGKKLNDKLYEYYPNKLIDLNIKLVDDMSYIEELVKKIEVSKQQNNNLKSEQLKSQIDKYFYKIYRLNIEEINLIENYY